MKQMDRIRNSERSDFKRCQQRWWWGWVEGLVPTGVAEPDALWFGTGVHLALANWYRPPTRGKYKGDGTRRGINPRDTWRDYCKNEVRYIKSIKPKTDGSIWTTAEELGHAMLTGYLELYGKDESWEIIGPEYTFAVRIPDRNGNPLVICNGTFDIVYRDLQDGLIKIEETKTAKVIDTGHLTLDDQAGTYWAIASTILRKEGVLKPKQRIAGIEYNFLRKALPDDRPVDENGQALNKNGSVSKTQRAPLFERHFVRRSARERNPQIRRIADEYEHKTAVKDGQLPILKTPRQSGVDACRGCPFFEMCELHEQGMDWEGYRDKMFEETDKYADHR